MMGWHGKRKRMLPEGWFMRKADFLHACDGLILSVLTLSFCFAMIIN